MKSGIRSKKDRLVVYTALFGDYDELIEPERSFKGCDFVCFTDQKNLQSDIWKIRLVEECDLPPNMMNRRYKLLPHLFFPEYERSLYVDANIKIKRNPLLLADKYLDNYDIAIPKHFSRNCIYKEAEEIVLLGRASACDVGRQIELYRKLGFPENYGLCENNVIIRKHNSKKIICAMKNWWDLLNSHTQRDQLSLMFVFWQKNIKVNSSVCSARGSRFFTLRPHLSDKHGFSSMVLKIKFNYPALYKFFYNFIKS